MLKWLYINKGALFGVCSGAVKVGESVPYNVFGLKSKKDKNGMLI